MSDLSLEHLQVMEDARLSLDSAVFPRKNWRTTPMKNVSPYRVSLSGKAAQLKFLLAPRQYTF